MAMFLCERARFEASLEVEGTSFEVNGGGGGGKAADNIAGKTVG